MNAHNEQHDPACIAAYEQLFQADSRDPSQTERLGVWATSWNAALAAQPAAAQEAVMLYYVANVEKGGDFNYIPISMFDQPAIFTDAAKAKAFCDFANGVGSKHEVRTFAAPVTAAPVDLDALAVNRYRPVPDGLLAYKVVAGDGTRSLFSGTMNECNVVARKLTEAFLDGAHVASTLAAPGIDLTPFRELADAWQKESSEALGQFPPIEGNHRSQMIRLGKCAHKLHNLIDASPKGALNEQFGSAEGLSAPEDDGLAVRRVADHMAQVIDYIGKRCPDAVLLDHGPILRNIRQWEKRLRAVLMDSPKGGSEARAYTTGHCENHKKPGGCPLHNLQCGYPQCDRQPASDAEVPPLCDLCRKRPEAHSDAEGIGFCEDCWDAWVQANSHGAGDQT